MHGSTTSTPFPLPLMLGVGAVMGVSMIAALVGRSEGVGVVEPPAGTPVASVDFRAEDQVDGSIVLRDAADQRIVAMVRPGEDGFIRGTLRGLAKARQREGLGREVPFRLTRFEDGRLALSDAANGRRVALDAFGKTNAQAFARLLPDETRDETRNP